MRAHATHHGTDGTRTHSRLTGNSKPHPADSRAGRAPPSADRILVVDDEENITFLLRSALRHFGFDVASDGRSALSAVRAAPPDLIVLDVMLPDVDGFEICRRLRGEGVETPVLFLTARDGSDEAVRGLTLGGDDYVTKPFSLEEVIARIQALLRRTGGRTRSSKLSLADLEMDDDAHIVRRAGRVIDLSSSS